jgi:hypothetical protein
MDASLGPCRLLVAVVCRVFKLCVCVFVCVVCDAHSQLMSKRSRVRARACARMSMYRFFGRPSLACSREARAMSGNKCSRCRRA